MTNTWDIPDGYEAVIGGEIDVSELTDLIVAAQIAIDGSTGDRKLRDDDAGRAWSA